jgi:hypothetical protein
MMAKRKRAKDKTGDTASRRRGATVRSVAKVAMIRIARTTSGPAAARATSAAGDPGVPIATIAAGGGPVTVGISFGQAQHANYAIQLFDSTGATELSRQSGMNTDSIPDQFVLQTSPAQLDRDILQWSGIVTAFSPAPGQQFSITFDVTQNGVGVPGGRVQRSGQLNVAQAFVGVLRLVTQ